MGPRPHRLGRLSLALVGAVAAASGCIGPNPAYTGVDALGPRGGVGGAAGWSDGGIDGGGAGGTGGGLGGTGGGAGQNAGDGGDAVGGASNDGAPPADASLPPDTAWLDVAPPADMSSPPDVMGPSPGIDMAAPVDLPAADRAPDAPRPATSRFNFEASAQGWGDLRPGTRDFPTTVTRMTAPAPAWDGQWAIAIAMRSGTSTSLASTHRIIGVAQEFRSQLPANTTISYRLWLPAGDALDYIQPFVLYYKPADANGDPQWGGVDPPLFTTNLERGEWVTITHQVPSNADSRGVVEVGLEFVLRPSRNLTVYLDGVHW